MKFMKICGKEIRVEGRLLRIARLDADKYHFLDDPEAVIEAVRKSGVRVDLFTFVQKLPETLPKYNYPMEWDNFAALPISTFDHWWTKQLGFKARNKAKQAEKKGIVIREVPLDDSLVQGIWEIYNESPIRQGRRYPHFGKDLETVRREEATYLESSQFIGAFDGGKLIGFVKLVTDESGTQAGLMNILSLIEHRDKAPTNALVAHAVRYCASRGIPYLVYSSFAYGKKQSSSISDFKERNGFERFDVPRYYVPLTRIGRSALRLGLHKKMTDRLPESVLHPIRELRSTWYSRFQTINESA
jgi:hypothetical protein